MPEEDFCKRSEETGIQKRFFCNVCSCQIQSVSALKEHVAGGKHTRSKAEFDPFQKKDFDKKNMNTVSGAPFTVTLFYMNKWFGSCQNCHCNRSVTLTVSGEACSCIHIQSGAAGHSLGFVNKNLGSSPGLLGQ